MLVYDYIYICTYICIYIYIYVYCSTSEDAGDGPGTAIKIHQRGVQWVQGVVICMMLHASALYETSPIHCTPLRLHPPTIDTSLFAPPNLLVRCGFGILSRGFGILGPRFRNTQASVFTGITI